MTLNFYHIYDKFYIKILIEQERCYFFPSISNNTVKIETNIREIKINDSNRIKLIQHFKNYIKNTVPNHLVDMTLDEFDHIYVYEYFSMY